MAIPTFYHPDLAQGDGKIQLSEDEAAHALRSRRLVTGQAVQLLNGKGLVAQAEISEIDHRSVFVTVSEVTQAKQNESNLTIATAVPKGDRQRFMVEMLTQLGVKEIVPLACEHSVTRYKPKMHDKWQRWAIEACKQSQNPWLPEIDEGLALGDLLKIAPNRLIYADKSGDSISNSGVQVEDPIVLIGPEGGFSEAELALFKTAGLASLSTAGHILRTETAAVAFASQWLAR